jgi:LytS/YehU family sensor histidine kinase
MASKISQHIATIKEQETAKRELIEMQKQFEVDVLKKQMSPHFLFNALNSIATLATIDPGQSAAMTQKLATLYRMILEATKYPAISMERELAIVEAYLELEKIRFGDRLDYKLKMEREYRNVLVPSLLLQTLVENAIKHGVAKARTGGTVEISCGKTGENRLQCTIRNSGAAYEPLNEQDKADPNSTGTGLANSRRRLSLMFGASSTLTIASDQDNWTVVSFSLPLL